jgi:hypothetical protein
MSLVVLLLSGPPGEVSLGPRSLSVLASLGVTSVALVAHEDTVGLVLDGWAFDPERALEAGAAVGAESATVLRSLVQMAVSTATIEGEHDGKADPIDAGGTVAARVGAH